MTRTATLVAITLLSAITTPVVVHATTPKTNAVAAKVMVAAPKAVEPSCARQVRVVYAGYGEGQGAPCIASTR
jgi:hypothetical protein